MAENSNEEQGRPGSHQQACGHKAEVQEENSHFLPGWPWKHNLGEARC